MTGSDVITYARAVTDTEVTTQNPDASVLPVLNAVYQLARRRLAARIPQLYTARVSFTATAATQDVTASPLSLTNFGVLRRIRRLVQGTDYEPVGVANEPNPDIVPFDQTYAALMRGNVIEFYPSSSIIGNTFEISYLTQPVDLTAVGNTLDVPQGFQECLGEFLAAKFRLRLEEQQRAHYEAGQLAFDNFCWTLINTYGVQSEGLYMTSTR